MKIAYLMLVHKNPQLLQKAIGALSSEGCAFFIHIDKKTNIDNFSGLKGNNIYLSENRVSVCWGEFSQVEATLQLIRQALGSAAKYDYFVFLQGSDYPLRSGTYIQRFLAENRGWEFMSAVKMPAPGYPLSKINKLRYPSDRSLRRFASRVLAKVGLAQRDYRKYLGRIEAYAGDACWTLSREACQYVIDFTERNQHFERYFRNAFTSDEVFFHTILRNSPFTNRSRRSLLYRDWSKPGDHPAMLDETHIRLFEERETVWVQDQFGSGEALFARKFSDDSLDLLGRIDAMIKRKEKDGQCPWPASSSLGVRTN